MGALPALAGLSRRAESMLAGAVLLAMAILPVIEMAVRGFGGSGIPGAQSFVQHLTLWVAFLGAMLATREGRHLSLSTGLKIFPDRIQHYGDMLAAAASTAVSAGLFWASYMFVKSEYEFSMGAGGHWLPAWAMEAILPLAFLVMTLRLMFQPKDRAVRLAAFAGVALTIALIGLGMAIDDGLVEYMTFPGWLVWPGLVALFVAAVMGAPIFVVIGGAALLLFMGEDVPVAAVPPDRMILDVGQGTAHALAEALGECRTLLWNGPLGAFEIPPFDAGTNTVARAAAMLTRDGRLLSVAGGGDTVAALSAAGVVDDFSYVSTAGGAFLEWLEGKTLPGVAALFTGG